MLRNLFHGIVFTLVIVNQGAAQLDSDNVQTLLDWAGALGFELVLRPVPMTALALRTIVETRDKTAARSKRMTLENRRRGERASRGA
mgnify:CR=1 FL=1